MEQTFDATTVELDKSGFEELKEQILDGKKNPNKEPDIRDEPKQAPKKEAPQVKKYTLNKGEEAYQVDDDFEIEFTADKKPVKLTLRELKDRAAGDIAIKNRMHALAEEKKKVQATLKEFARLSKDDPLGALEYISSKAKESDSEFEYNSYLQKLADQAEKLGRMDEKERKNWELEKKLQKAEENLSQKERQQAVVQRKQEMLSNYPQIGDSEFGQMVDAVLGSEELLQGVETESEVMDRVEELIQETLTQRDIVTVIQEINPSYTNDTKLIFALSDQIRQNPDLEESDIRDIITDLIGSPKKGTSSVSKRDKDIQTLSEKQRQSVGVNEYREQNASAFDLLKQQLLENKDKFKKTPIQMR